MQIDGFEYTKLYPLKDRGGKEMSLGSCEA
jgi:hypothetical protein